jgi:hypothetical protein
MKWSAIAESEPALGVVVSERLIGPGVLLVGTGCQPSRSDTAAA